MDTYGNVDYIRLTLRANAGQGDLMRLAEARQGAIEVQGGRYETRRWYWQRYSGFQVGSVSWGSRDDGHILQVSGAIASSVADSALPEVWSCPRLDVAATVLLTGDDVLLAKRAAEQAAALAAAGQPGARRKVRLERTFGDGDTVYLGTRKSRVFARIYDKHRESLGNWPVGAWRYEIEAHNEAARHYLTEVRKVGKQNQACVDLVHQWFAGRGIEVPFQAGDSVDSSIPAKKTDKSDTAWLRWLRQQVEPSIQKHIDRVGIDAILEALPSLRDVRK